MVAICEVRKKRYFTIQTEITEERNRSGGRRGEATRGSNEDTQRLGIAGISYCSMVNRKCSP